MDEKEKIEIAETESAETAEQPKRRRGGRRPKAAEENTAEPKKRTAKKAAPTEPTSATLVQYGEKEVDVAALMDAAKADFRTVKKRLPIRDIKLYIKPEESAAYYVINGEYSGKVDF